MCGNSHSDRLTVGSRKLTRCILSRYDEPLSGEFYDVTGVIEPLLGLMRRDPETALLAAVGAYLLLLILTLWSLLQYAGMARRQKRLLRGADGASLERMLREHMEGAEKVRRDLAGAAEQGVANDAALRLCLQRVGVVRYDAFMNVGGEQSFSLALLDADASGIVLSGLYSRNDMRVYAKPVSKGTSPVVLTDEERQAIANARRQ